MGWNDTVWYGYSGQNIYTVRQYEYTILSIRPTMTEYSKKCYCYTKTVNYTRIETERRKGTIKAYHTSPVPEVIYNEKAGQPPGR